MESTLIRSLVCLALGLVVIWPGKAPAQEASAGLPTEAPAGAPPGTSPTSPAEAARPRTVLLLGDSLIVTDFGRALEERLNAEPGLRAVRRAKSSTGLARPDFFDWMKAGQEEVARHQPDVVVVILGGNDGQGLTDEHGKAQVQWGASGWEAAYQQRATDFLRLLSAPGRKVLWVELPFTGLPRFERKLGLIRRVLRTAVAGEGTSRHLDTRAFFVDGRGQLVRDALVEGFRKPMRLRMADGVHFTLAGGRYFASKVHPEVLALLTPEPPAPAPEGGTCHEGPSASLVPLPLALCAP